MADKKVWDMTFNELIEQYYEGKYEKPEIEPIIVGFGKLTPHPIGGGSGGGASTSQVQQAQTAANEAKTKAESAQTAANEAKASIQQIQQTLSSIDTAITQIRQNIAELAEHTGCNCSEDTDGGEV